MIFSTLEHLDIPYIVVRYRVTAPVLGECGSSSQYMIMTECDQRLYRHGFREEREIYRYRGAYMYRRLSKREVRIFRLRAPAPVISNDDGAIWECNGLISKRPKRQYKKDPTGKFSK